MHLFLKKIYRKNPFPKIYRINQCEVLRHSMVLKTLGVLASKMLLRLEAQATFYFFFLNPSFKDTVLLKTIFSSIESGSQQK